MKEYQRWCELAVSDEDVKNELEQMQGKDEVIEDAFYRNLAFGTGGLRGVIGAGTNRMNIYTVAKASQGLADYVKECFETSQWKIAISYDSRIKSDIFAKVAGQVFLANGIEVWIYPELMPTPCLSFAVRELKCAAGVMVTASHNPAKYNGYKVYGADGCQITTEAAKEILEKIERIDIFKDVKGLERIEAARTEVVGTEIESSGIGDKEDDELGKESHVLKTGQMNLVPEEVTTKFVECVKAQSLLTNEDKVDKGLSIVFTPLNGTGLKPVLRTLKESGYTNITVVKEQENPDGNFTTCPYPNPEIREAMDLGIQYAKAHNADLLLATDPDCDRVGIAVKGKEDYVLLSGNETGLLLFDYICSRRQELGLMPEYPVMAKTIVTTDMGEQIAAHYGVEVINVLTGFKFIGEQIGFLEQQGREKDYIFGFEESYGYLSGSYVRDKDGVNAAFLICEMFAYYQSKGISLLEKLQELYDAYGYCLNTLHSYEFEGAVGFEKMQQIMEKFRGGVSSLGGRDVKRCLDYSLGIDGLPKSNVLKFYLEGNCSVVVRPSGTEPKLKLYLSISASGQQEALAMEELLLKDFKGYMD